MVTKSGPGTDEKTIIVSVLTPLIKLYEVMSPCWWILTFLKKGQCPAIWQANVTDIFVMVRFLYAGLALFVLPLRLSLFFLNSYIIFELLFAITAHFFGTKYNSAGAGYTTQHRRTLLIALINTLTLILLFAYLQKYLIGTSSLHAVYISFSAISAVGFSNDVVSRMSKFIACIELSVGVFILTFIFASIVGWMEPKKESVNMDPGR